MKILWLTHRDPVNPKAGGAEKIIGEIGRRLVESGNEVTVFAPMFKNCPRTEYFNGIRILRKGGSIGVHFAMPLLILKEDFDVIIADLGHAIPWISPLLLRKKVIVHFLHLHRRSLPGQVSKVLAFAVASIERCYFILYHNSKFVTISNTSLSDLTSRLQIKSENCTIIRPGVNSELFIPVDKSPSPTMIYFGGMRNYKRPYEALKLLTGIVSRIPEITLTVIGDGPSKEKMVELAEASGLSKNVIFTGRLSPEELARQVGRSWLNVHTSITEGWGISIIEAASAGTPTVGYDVPGVAESIENGNNGIKVLDGDIDSLIQAAETIINDPTKWWITSVEVAKKYSWDVASKGWQSILESVNNSNQRNPKNKS